MRNFGVKFGLMSALMALGSCTGYLNALSSDNVEGQEVEATVLDGREGLTLSAERAADYYNKLCVERKAPQELGFTQGEADGDGVNWISDADLISVFLTQAGDCEIFFYSTNSFAQMRYVFRVFEAANFAAVVDVPELDTRPARAYIAYNNFDS